MICTHPQSRSNVKKRSQRISSNSHNYSHDPFMTHVISSKAISYARTKFRPPEVCLLINISINSPNHRNIDNRKRFKSRSTKLKLFNLKSFLKSEDLPNDERSIWTLRQELDIKKSIYKRCFFTRNNGKCY